MHPLSFNNNIYKIVLSNPTKANSTYARIEILSNGEKFQASMFTDKQVFHKNLQPNEVEAFVLEQLAANFVQYTAWDNNHEYAAKVTKKGKMLTSSKLIKSPPARQDFAGVGFNKQKKHIIQEGDNIPALVDMGIFTTDYKVISDKQDKFRQINRFIELIADEAKSIKDGTTVNIIDFGCGKSYLTFLTYHYFTNIRKLRVNICGLDLKKSVIENCTAAAQKYGYDSLTFKLGDIGKQATPPLESWNAPNAFNIVISLHACDTATDYALFNAIKWKANLIYVAPCCQHELNKQIKPQTLDILSDYGLIQERFAALATDAIRAKLLEAVGYKTQVIEFIDTEHTPKNIMIRAKRTKKLNPQAIESVKALTNEFSFNPTLLYLLQEAKTISLGG